MEEMRLKIRNKKYYLLLLLLILIPLGFFLSQKKVDQNQQSTGDETLVPHVTLPESEARTKIPDKKEYVPDQYIFVFADSITDPGATAKALEKQYNLRILHIYELINGFSAYVPPGKLPNLEQDSRIQSIEQDSYSYLAAPNPSITDQFTSRWPSLGAFVRPDAEIVRAAQGDEFMPRGARRMGADLAHVQDHKGAGTVVAVLDTGVYGSHEDISFLKDATGKIIGKDCVTYKAEYLTTGRGYTDDVHGHGTHIASIIASPENGKGIIGVAPEAKIVPIKIHHSLNSRNGIVTNALESDRICALEWLAQHAKEYGIRVVNISLAGPDTVYGPCGKGVNRQGKRVIDLEHKAYCAAMKASGNTLAFVVAGVNKDFPAQNSTPAGYDDIVTTISVLMDSDGQPDGSDYISNNHHYGSPPIDVAAPSNGTYAAWSPTSYIGSLQGKLYAEIGGGHTSYSAPHVAGAMALYFSIHPNASWTDARDCLVKLGEQPTENGEQKHASGGTKHPEPVLRVCDI